MLPRFRLMIKYLMYKCLTKMGLIERCLQLIQMQYLESPHFSSLLYLYGKYIIQNPQLHSGNLSAGISALEEVLRISCQARKAKACFWLSTAYLENGQLTLAGLYQAQYLSSIRQVTRSGTVNYKPIYERVDVSVQQQVIEQVSKSPKPSREKKDPVMLSPQEELEGQGLEQAFIPDTDLVIACMRVQNQRE